MTEKFNQEFWLLGSLFKLHKRTFFMSYGLFLLAPFFLYMLGGVLPKYWPREISGYLDMILGPITPAFFVTLFVTIYIRNRQRS